MTDPPQYDWNEWRLYARGCGWTDDVLAKEATRASKLGIGPWELHIFDSIVHGYGQVRSKELLADRAFGTSRSKYPTQAAEALRRCFAEDWVQFLTRDFLDAMKRELAEGGYLTPSGLIGGCCDASADDPTNPVGLISFTRRGASLYLQWLGIGPDTPDTDYWVVGETQDGWRTVYGTSIAALDFALDDCLERIVDRESPAIIGRWCGRWWRRFENGYQIRVRLREEPDR